MALIEKFEERASKNITGTSFGYSQPIQGLKEFAKDRTSIWFTTVDMEKSIFSIAVSMTAYANGELTSVKVQTDFNLYPYGNFESIGGVNSSIFVKMMNIARQNCINRITAINKNCASLIKPNDDNQLEFYLELMEPISE